jgi:hypothetical protein
MKQRLLTLTLLVLALALTLTPVVGRASEAANRPKILLIAVDDMGYSDVGSFGSEIKTPNVDLLAKKRQVLL